MTARQREAIVNLMSLSATQLAQLTLGITSLCWAVALIHRPITHPALVLLLEIMPQAAWAGAFCCISAFEFGCLLRLIRSCRFAPQIRGVLAVMWIFIAISLLLSNIIAAGDVAVSLLAIWLFLRQAVRDDCDGSH